jgi:hypothetical protein
MLLMSKNGTTYIGPTRDGLPEGNGKLVFGLDTLTFRYVILGFMLFTAVGRNFKEISNMETL